MPVRETSIEAYNKIKASGLLSKLLVIHLKVFYDYPYPMTSRVAHRRYFAYNSVEPNLNQFRSKITMLVDQHALEELPKKILDPETGMRVTLYRPSGFCLDKQPQRKTRFDLFLDDFYNYLEDEAQAAILVNKYTAVNEIREYMGHLLIKHKITHIAL